jgi:hypothetical protein
VNSLTQMEVTIDKCKYFEIQFNSYLLIIRIHSLHIYLSASLTAQRPITKRARVERKTHTQNTINNKSKEINPLTQIKAKT